ncbi:AP-5 complex subunit sigma-1-like [Orbicella faveolata]|uniref:AP-5 complex subunit sigma-1-like n=1 Tax=Orbicella faveolata TaxID=48498 RepID=UPI0009E326F6|nr:AP-5 complex subunit sigma-1-like [Orbicella faveolata]
MVYAFLIHSLTPGPCRVLYSTPFVHEPPLDGVAGEDERSKRKEQLLQVAQRVQSEYSFRYVASGSESQEDLSGLSSTDELLSNLKAGVFRLSSGNPYKAERVVLWKGLANSGFTLVCEKNENRLIAENILDLLIRHLQEYCQVILQPSEAILKVDKVAAIVHQLLPNGQLLFMNNRYLRQVEKELEQVMNLKRE